MVDQGSSTTQSEESLPVCILGEGDAHRMPPQLCFLVQGHLPASEVIWMDSRQDGRGWSCHQPSSAGAAHEPLLATSHSLWGANSICRHEEADAGEVAGQESHYDGFLSTGGLSQQHLSVLVLGSLLLWFHCELRPEEVQI